MMRTSVTVATLAVCVRPAMTFQIAPTFCSLRTTRGQARRTHFNTGLASSIGGDDNGRPPPPDDGNNNKKGGDWEDFLNPKNEESESMQKAREFLSENSLPISFDETDFPASSSSSTTESIQDTGGQKPEPVTEDDDMVSPPPPSSSSSSALVASSSSNPNDELLPNSPSADVVARNPYLAVVSRLSPSELISRFTTTAHPRVQNAVRSTILGLIGGLPKMAFDTTTITTGQRLASLMFQLQMTGYMFKNAEYKLSMQQVLGVDDESKAAFLLKGMVDDDDDDHDHDDAENWDPLKGKIRGKIRVHYNKEDVDATTSDRPDSSSDEDTAADDEASSTGTTGSRSSRAEDGGTDIEVDAAAYMSELRSEVSKLRDELMVTRKEKEEALRKDLLTYIRTLPEQELRSLTNTMSQDVLVAMKGLVGAVMAGIGEGQIKPDTVTEQSGEAMAQLCMWQLAVGYNLRTLEVREEMKKSLSGAAFGDTPTDEGGVDLSEPGALE